MPILTSHVENHKDYFGVEAQCQINETLFYGDFSDDDYKESCNISSAFTFKENDTFMGTLCPNHISQLKELGVDGFMTEYSELEDYADDEYPFKEMFQNILDYPNLEALLAT